jgi:enoyl-CoA hydratase/carnithine racemase
MLVLTEKRDLIATITLNRPEKLNALSHELVAELVEAFDALREDEQVRALVLTGTGRAFSAGADLGGQRAEHGRTIEEWEARMAENQARQFMARDFPKPVIAAVDGYCLGRGCELALWCDVVIASEEAKFGEPEIRHGSMVASMIPWLTNPQQAKLLILTGDTISAQEAVAMGLVARVVAQDRVVPEAQRIARRMAKVPPFAVRYNKQLINAMYDTLGFRQAMDYGHKIETLCHSRIPEAENVDGVNLEQLRRKAGVRAFLEARDGPFRED